MTQLRLASLPLTLLLLGNLACEKEAKPPEPGTWPGTSGGQTTGGGDEPGSTPTPSGVTQTLDDLHPVIQEGGESGVTPERLVVELSQSIVPGPGASTEGTELQVQPDPGGSVAFTGPSTLVYTPASPFLPNTTYQVTLVAIRGSDGVIQKGQTVYSRNFTTPELRFLRADLYAYDAKKHRATIDLVYTGAVEVGTVGKVTRFKLAGRSLSAQWTAGPTANVVRAELADSRLDYGKIIDLDQSGAVPHAASDQHRAPGAHAEIKIPDGKAVNIYSASLNEGTSGFYIQVVCSDEAVGNNDLYFWDEGTQNSYEVSRRCVLDELDAKDGIKLDPPSKFQIAPSRGGFRILGDFKRGNLSLRIASDSRTIDGGVVKTPKSFSFSVPARKPQVSFTSSGRYLPRSAWQQLPIRHLNLGKGELRVRHVKRENLVFWMSGNEESANPKNSDLILNQELALKSEPDSLTTQLVDVATLLPKAPNGLLEIEVSGPKGTPSAKARLILTNLNLIAKHEESGDQVKVWAIGIEDNQPVSGVKVEQIVESGRVISSCSTDSSGTCSLNGVPKEAVDQAQPFALIASKGDDVTYLKYDELRTQIEEEAVQGEPQVSDRPYRASVWSDRGVYRPGDTAHLGLVMRDQASLAPPEGMPVELRLIDPKQKVAKKQVEKINAAGVVAFDVPFGVYADTGVYQVLAYVADKMVGGHQFNVEEFVPERMKVEVQIPGGPLELSATAQVQVAARYLFGGSAAGSRVELSCELRPTTWKPEKAKQYNFGVWSDKPPQPIPLGTASGEIGEDGSAKIDCPALNGRGSFRGPAKVVAKAAVFESGSGRTTQNDASAVVHPERYYVGLSSGTRQVKGGATFNVEGAVVDWEGNPSTLAKEVTLNLYRIEREYDWTYEEGEGSWSYRHYQRLALDGSMKAKVEGGRFTAALTPGQDGGSFIVRAEAGNARTDLELEGSGEYYWYWEGSGEQDRTPRPLTPVALPLTTPASGKVGEPLKVNFDAPFTGRALLTVETGEVVESEWRDLVAGKQEWTFTVDKFAPNVYASVLLVKDPRLESKKGFVPSRAFGVRSIRIEPLEFTREVKISAPSEVRSNSRLEVKLDLGELDEPTYVTVAAVDEGILSLTRFQSPNPLDDIFAKRRLGVTTFETIGWNLLLPSGDTGSTSGGDGAGGPGRVQPVKPVALWSGLVEVPKNGQATVAFDVPQYRGSLRVMVVGAGKKKLLHGDVNVLVRDPLVLQTTLPRFLTYGDLVEVPVFVTNLSGQAQEISVELEAVPLAVAGVLAPEGQDRKVIEVQGAGKKALSLKHEANGTVIFPIKALRAVGAAQLRVAVSAGELRSEETLDVPFLPAAPRTRTLQRIALEAGTIDLLPYLSGWLPTTERSTFWVTNNPYGDTFDHLKYLLRYPYGCIEQTTSTTRPLLFAAKLIGNVDPALVGGKTIDQLVMHGVNRVLSMQTPDGGFSYWPGDPRPVPWGTAYGLHMLIDAQKLRYPVPEERIKEALDWVERELNLGFENNSRDWYYGRDGEAYLHYVLALSGRGKKAKMQKLLDDLVKKPDPHGEIKEQIYMLQAGLYAAGDHRYEKELKTPDLSALRTERINSWSFYSDRRRRGFMLSTYVDLFGPLPTGEPLANLVAEGVRGQSSGWYTTQELAWSLTGLGKFVGDLASTFDPAELYANGKKIGPQSVEVTKEEAKSDRTWSLYRSSEYRSLELKNPGAKDGKKLYLILSSEGIKPEARYETGGSALRLERAYFTPTGEPIGADVELGALIYVVVTIKNQTGDRIQNVALVDRFPAGLEIENPRLGRGGAIDWIDQESLFVPDYLNIRDDRLEVFGAVEPRAEKKVVYALRAVSAGKYVGPPVEAEAMYDPSVWAREAGSVLNIRGPWEK